VAPSMVSWGEDEVYDQQLHQRVVSRCSGRLQKPGHTCSIWEVIQEW